MGDILELKLADAILEQLAMVARGDETNAKDEAHGRRGAEELKDAGIDRDLIEGGVDGAERSGAGAVLDDSLDRGGLAGGEGRRRDRAVDVKGKVEGAGEVARGEAAARDLDGGGSGLGDGTEGVGARDVDDRATLADRAGTGDGESTGELRGARGAGIERERGAGGDGDDGGRVGQVIDPGDARVDGKGAGAGEVAEGEHARARAGLGDGVATEDRGGGGEVARAVDLELDGGGVDGQRAEVGRARAALRDLGVGGGRGGGEIGRARDGQGLRAEVEGAGLELSRVDGEGGVVAQGQRAEVGRARAVLGDVLRVVGGGDGQIPRTLDIEGLLGQREGVDPEVDDGFDGRGTREDQRADGVRARVADEGASKGDVTKGGDIDPQGGDGGAGGHGDFGVGERIQSRDAEGTGVDEDRAAQGVESGEEGDTVAGLANLVIGESGADETGELEGG